MYTYSMKNEPSGNVYMSHIFVISYSSRIISLNHISSTVYSNENISEVFLFAELNISGIDIDNLIQCEP